MMQTSAVNMVVLSLCLLLNACVTQNSKPPIDEEKAFDAAIAAGIGYLKAEKFDRSRYHIQRALELQPDSSMALSALALLYRQEGDDPKAEQYFIQAVNAKEPSSQANNNYGVMLYENARYQEAIEQFKLAAENPYYELRGAAWANIGKSYQQLNNMPQAVTAWEKAVRLDSRLPSPSFELAKYYFQHNDIKKAQTYYFIFEKNGQQNEETASLGLAMAESDRNLAAIHKYKKLLQQLK